MEPVSPQLYYLMYFNYFYPQAPHGACQSYFSSALKIYLISILRLRMEPVKMQAFLKNLCEYFYPQAPHGACQNSSASTKQSILISILRLRMEPVEDMCRRCSFSIAFLSSGSAWSLSAKNTKNMSYSHSVFLQHYQ